MTLYANANLAACLDPGASGSKWDDCEGHNG